ncbi:MAG: hypothetical protein AAFZ09_21200, partial [Pseudomonadota bacterium]
MKFLLFPFWVWATAAFCFVGALFEILGGEGMIIGLTDIDLGCLSSGGRQDVLDLLINQGIYNA